MPIPILVKSADTTDTDTIGAALVMTLHSLDRIISCDGNTYTHTHTNEIILSLSNLILHLISVYTGTKSINVIKELKN